VNLDFLIVRLLILRVGLYSNLDQFAGLRSDSPDRFNPILERFIRSVAWKLAEGESAALSFPAFRQCSPPSPNISVLYGFLAA
jgi:hypothetical protein